MAFRPRTYTITKVYDPDLSRFDLVTGDTIIEILGIFSDCDWESYGVKERDH
jgi:hypothetical protein